MKQTTNSETGKECDVTGRRLPRSLDCRLEGARPAAARAAVMRHSRWSIWDRVERYSHTVAADDESRDAAEYHRGTLPLVAVVFSVKSLSRLARCFVAHESLAVGRPAA